MHFAKSVFTLLAAASSAVAITITGPSASSYWVQNTSNIISWTFTQGDPNPIDITVTNTNTSFLPGPFSIARFVDLTNGTFTVTNVTLSVGTGYIVNFINSTDGIEVFASSGQFEVRPPGTPPATTSSAAPTSTAPSTTSGTATGTDSTGTETSNASPRAFNTDFNGLPLLVSAGMALAGCLLVL